MLDETQTDVITGNPIKLRDSFLFKLYSQVRDANVDHSVFAVLNDLEIVEAAKLKEAYEELLLERKELRLKETK